MTAPLHGVKVVEFEALGPAPMAAMILADLGAEVVRIERPVRSGQAEPAELFDRNLDILRRGRKIVTLNLKDPGDRETALGLVDQADILIEGLRPGVMERLGLGPQICEQRNARLIYGRMTGWGQTGPLAAAVGHDINYLAITGALHAIGEAGRGPVVPLNVIGDGGGGAMLLVVGVLAGLTRARVSGHGQIVDAAMTDGVSVLMAMIHTLKAMGSWTVRRGENLLDGGAHFYGCYRCSDDRWIAVGAIEPQFYACLLDRLAITDPDFHPQMDRARWPSLKAKLAAVFITRTRAQWCELLEGTDACVSPVLDLEEAAAHPHNIARQTLAWRDGVLQPAPAPRFSPAVPS